MATLQVEVISVERVALSEDEVQVVRVPTLLGEISILPHHEPLVSILVPGVIEVRLRDRSVHLECGAGFVEVSNNAVAILAEQVKQITKS